MPNEMITMNNTPTVDNIPVDELRDSMKRREEANKDLTSVDFVEWAKLLLQMVDMENRDEELRRHRKITKLMRYYRGEQRGFWSHTTGDWVTVNPDDFEPRDAVMLLINNQIRPQVKSLSKEWARSRSRFRVKARDDTIQKKGAARFATGLAELQQDRLMPESFRQVEAKSAFLAGNYLRRTYFNKNLKKYTATIPELKKQKTQGTPEIWWCADCNREGTMDMLPSAGSSKPTCPYCGSQSIQKEQSAPKDISTLAGMRKEQIGDIETELIDVREIKVHLRARTLRQTPYLRRKRYVMVAILKEQYPWADIKPKQPGAITKYIQETELSSGTSGAHHRLPFNYDGYGMGLGGMTEYDELWVRPSLYYDLKFKKNVKLGSGVEIKAGTKFIDLYPEGMYICFSAGTELLNIDRDTIDEQFTHGAYDPLIESFWGDGLEDLVQMQELVNEMQSLFIENIIYNASPKIIYNPWLIEASMFSNNPSEMTPLSRNAKRDDKPSDAVFQFSGMNIAQDVPNAITQGIETMRVQSGAYLAMSGSSDPKLNTATAMAIARDAAVAQLGPPLAIKSEADVGWIYQVLKLQQKNWVDGVHDKLLGNYSIQEAQWFRECHIEDDLEIIVEPGSWIPRTDLEVRNDFLSFITAGGVPLGFANPDVPYEIKQKAAELFRMPIDLDKLQPDIRNANLRIEQLQSVANILIEQGIIDATTEDDGIVAMMVADVPVDTYIDDHQVIINVYTAWLKTDPGKFAPMVVHDSVELLIQNHKKAMEFLSDEQFNQQAKYAVAAQAMEGMVDNAKQADAMANEQAMQPQQQQPTEPIPTGTQSKSRPTTSQAQASSAKTPQTA